MVKINGSFAFIGCGNMGSAIVRGFTAGGVVQAGSIRVFDKCSANYQSLQQLGVQTVESIDEAVSDVDYIFLCVKPKDVSSVVSECCRASNYKRSSVFVSIAAAVPISLICEAAGEDVPVIRTMPAMPMLIGEGAIAVCKNDLVDNKVFAYICRLFSSIASVSVMDEVLLNPIISVNGSSPAYVYLFVKAMLEGAVKQGVPEDQALPLILQTIIGSAKMIEKSSCSLDEQISRVCSPGGTTLEAMKVLQESDFVSSVQEAMEACTKRANEISASLKE